MYVFLFFHANSLRFRRALCDSRIETFVGNGSSFFLRSDSLFRAQLPNSPSVHDVYHTRESARQGSAGEEGSGSAARRDEPAVTISSLGPSGGADALKHSFWKLVFGSSPNLIV